jgi:hypothetical protein
MVFIPDRRLESWPAFVDEVGRLDRGWIFRGGLRAWMPETALERACAAWRIPPDAVPDAERRLVREFRRHPEGRQLGLDIDDYLGWFAVMQHYGAPSRLLDWTYSPFIAAYFAFDALFDDRQSDDAPAPEAAVWALNTTWLEGALRARFTPEDWRLYHDVKNRESFSRLYVRRAPPMRFVSPATPLLMNERLSLQQSVFLCPGDVTHSWMDNLLALGFTGAPEQAWSFVMGRAVLPEAFDALQLMNVTGRTLFPGLDGYARSMHHRLKLLLDIPLPREE